MKPIIVIIGNCQASALANFLKATPGVSESFEIRRFRHCAQDLDADAAVRSLPFSPGLLKRMIDAERGRIVAFLRQASHNWEGDAITRDDLPPGVTFVEFPVGQVAHLWPLAFETPDFATLPQRIQLRYPYPLQDRLLSHLRGKGVPESEIVDAYMAHDVTGMYRLDRLKAISDAKMRQVDERASFPITEYVEANMASMQVFRTARHPAAPLLAHIIERTVERLPFIEDRADCRLRLDALAHSYGVQDYDSPIHPQIAGHFGLEWAKGARWRFWDEGSYTFEESLLRLYRYETSHTFPAALEKLAAGDLEAARSLMEQAVAETPRSAKFRLSLARLYTRLKLHDQAMEMARQSWEIEPSMDAGKRYARGLMAQRRVDQAVPVITTLHAKFAYEGANLAMLESELAFAQGRAAEAIQRLVDALAGPLARDANLWAALSASYVRARNPVGACAAMERAYEVSGFSARFAPRLAALRARLPDGPAKERSA